MRDKKAEKTARLEKKLKKKLKDAMLMDIEKGELEVEAYKKIISGLEDLVLLHENDSQGSQLSEAVVQHREILDDRKGRLESLRQEYVKE